jgi:hypothetical protein
VNRGTDADEPPLGGINVLELVDVAGMPAEGLGAGSHPPQGAHP